MDAEEKEKRINKLVRHLPKATPILEGEDARRFLEDIVENQDKKLPLVPTPKLEELRKEILRDWKQNSRLSLQVKPFFRWYDFWIGGYWDKVNRELYICPIPMFGLKISIRRVARKKRNENSS